MYLKLYPNILIDFMCRVFICFQVYDNCEDIPHYTPIATFEDAIYHPLGAQSGVFVQCVDDGFMVRCVQPLAFYF